MFFLALVLGAGAGAVLLFMFVVDKFGYRRPLKWISIIFGILAAGFAALNIIDQRERTKQEAARAQEEAQSLTRIPITQIALQHVTLDSSTLRARERKGASTPGFTLAARVENGSPMYTLSAIEIKVTFHDCPADAPKAKCVTIGETFVKANVNTPPGQARDISEFIDSAGMTKARERWTFDYAVSRLWGVERP
jgi:hypothetical protein